MDRLLFQIPIVVEGLFARLGYSERRKLVKTLLDHDREGLKETSTSSFSSFEKVNDLEEFGRFINNNNNNNNNNEFGRFDIPQHRRSQLDSAGELWKSSEEEEEGFY